jgi:P27 family predicted phage terminase small subunit
MRGPKIKPKRLLHTAPPQHAPLDPSIPPELTDAAARAEWTRVAPMVCHGHVNAVDRALLMAYCLKYAQWLAFERLAAASEPVEKAKTGARTQSAAIGLANRAFALMFKAAVELGMTPSSRSRVAVDVSKGYTAPIEDDPFSVFQAERRAAR